jgi:histidinol-phosphate aminotransferase
MQYNKILEKLPNSIPFKTPERIERENNAKFLLRMGANENIWGVSPLAIEAGFESLSESWKYNDPECFILRNALANHHGIRPKQLVFGEGIDGLLGLVVRACVNHGSPVVMSKGSYPTFEYHVYGYGSELIEVDYHDFKPDILGLIAAVKSTNAKLVYLANPDNPSGSFYDRHLITSFVESIPRDCMIILDEAYADFVDKEELLDETLLLPNLIRMRTFSKIYGLAALRVGYGIACESVIENLNKIRLQFGVGMVGQTMCNAALKDIDFVNMVKEQTANGRTQLYNIAKEIGLLALPSRSNFVAIDMGSRTASIKAVALLMEKGIFVRRPNKPSLDHFIRVTVSTKADCIKFGKVLAYVCKKLD